MHWRSFVRKVLQKRQVIFGLLNLHSVNKLLNLSVNWDSPCLTVVMDWSIQRLMDGVFLERAEFIITLHEDLEKEMAERSAGIGSDLTIGTPVITGEHILPPLLEQFHIRYPQVQVRLIEDSPRALEKLSAKGDTDISLLPLPIEDSRLATHSILTESIVLAVPPNITNWMSVRSCALLIDQSSGRRISLLALREAPFIVLKSGYGFRHTVLELCREAGFQPEIAYETRSIEMAQSLVAHGLGITLIPAMVKRQMGEKSPFYFELAENPVRTLSFIYRKDWYLTMASRAFIDKSLEVMGTFSHIEDGEQCCPFGGIKQASIKVASLSVNALAQALTLTS